MGFLHILIDLVLCFFVYFSEDVVARLASAEERAKVRFWPPLLIIIFNFLMFFLTSFAL